MADDQPDQNLFGSPLDPTFAAAEQPVTPAYPPSDYPQPDYPQAAPPAPLAGYAPPPSGYAPPAGYAPPPSGYAPPPYGYAPPAPPPYGYAPPPSGYAPPGQVPPGYPPSGYGFQPGYPGGAPPATGYPVMANPPKHGMSRRTIVLMSIAAGLIVLAMVAAAVAEAAKHEPSARAVTMPSSVLGWPQLHSGQLDAVAAQRVSALDSYHIFKNPQAAFFGDGSQPSLVVFVAKLPARLDTQEVNGFFHGMAGSMGRARMDVFDPGPFGGTLECSNASIDGTAGTICASLDSAAFIEVAEYTTDEAAVAADIRQIISAAEH